ncbi:hypothetical protein ABPG77_001987 [Micractinium sp. CCAP 211/92]
MSSAMADANPVMLQAQEELPPNLGAWPLVICGGVIFALFVMPPVSSTKVYLLVTLTSCTAAALGFALIRRAAGKPALQALLILLTLCLLEAAACVWFYNGFFAALVCAPLILTGMWAAGRY